MSFYNLGTCPVPFYINLAIPNPALSVLFLSSVGALDELCFLI